MNDRKQLNRKDTVNITELFCAAAWHEWVRRNHPTDWWSSQRHGRPLPDMDRHLACEFARSAFIAGWVAAQNTELTDRRGAGSVK